MLHTKVHNCRVTAKFKRLWNKAQKTMKCCMLVCTLMLIFAVRKLAERILRGSTGE